MPVPDFQSIMLPLLRLAGDGKEHVLADARSRLGSELKLTQAELDELLPSGGQTRFANRVAWAKVYLERGGLLESPQRGRFIISRRGREVLNAQPVRIDVKFLTQYPEFGEFQKAKRQTDEPTTQLATSEVANAEKESKEDNWAEFVVPPFLHDLGIKSQSKAMVIIGGRGCGKTTLLRYFCHATQFSPRRPTICADDLAHIGLYWRADTNFLNSFTGGQQSQKYGELLSSIFLPVSWARK